MRPPPRRKNVDREATATGRTRRRFLQAASAAAFALPPAADAAAMAVGQRLSPQPSQRVTARQFLDALEALAAKPGNKKDDAIFGTSILPFTVALTVETNTIDTQFEYHEDRDHLFQVLAGETTLEVGGTPQGGHSEQPGQWHAPSSEGTSIHTLRTGDMLLIPRGAPHKRTTVNDVSFLLISATSPLQR